MKFTYDPDANAIHVRLNDNEISESEEIRPDLIVDYDNNGNITGIEILNANKYQNDTMKKAA